MDKTDELRAEVERMRDQVREFREERDQALELVDQMRDQVEDADAVIESWLAETDLSMRTVRTTVERQSGTGRIGKRTNELRWRELDRLRAASYRAGKKDRNHLPARINQALVHGKALMKATKGL